MYFSEMNSITAMNKRKQKSELIYSAKAVILKSN